METISKKQLLAQTGISYGQLYRWKREGLIPEDWFIKQSSYTGQETFFPKEKILDRVEAITKYKDTYSLEELAKLFDPETSLTIDREDLAKVKEISPVLAEAALSGYDKPRYTLLEVALMATVGTIAAKAGLSEGETGDLLLNTMNAAAVVTAHTVCTFFLVSRAIHVAFTSAGDQLFFDKGVEVVCAKDLGEDIADMKLAYKDLLSQV